MKIVIIDERTGDQIDQYMRDKMQVADIVGCIQADNTVRVVKWRDGNESEIEFDVFDALHIDELSARRSEQARIKRIQELDAKEQEHSMPISEKIANGQALTGNSGTEEIHGV